MLLHEERHCNYHMNNIWIENRAFFQTNTMAISLEIRRSLHFNERGKNCRDCMRKHFKTQLYRQHRSRGGDRASREI